MSEYKSDDMLETQMTINELKEFKLQVHLKNITIMKHAELISEKLDIIHKILSARNINSR